MMIDVPNEWWAVVLLFVLAVTPIAIAVWRRIRFLWTVIGLVLLTSVLWPAWFVALALAIFDRRESVRA